MAAVSIRQTAPTLFPVTFYCVWGQVITGGPWEIFSVHLSKGNATEAARDLQAALTDFSEDLKKAWLEHADAVAAMSACMMTNPDQDARKALAERLQRERRA